MLGTAVRSAASALFAATLCLAASVPASAQSPVYSNGAPNGVSGNEMTQWIQASDFTLGSATTLTAARFWAFSLATNAYAGNVTWQIYSNAAGSPGSMLFSGNVVPTAIVDGPPYGGTTPTMRYDFALPNVGLGAGTYWFGLHNGPLSNTGRAEFYWETTAANTTANDQEDVAPFGDGFSPNGNEHAYTLYAGSTVPEPSTYAMLGGGLVTLAGLARRRRRAVTTG